MTPIPPDIEKAVEEIALTSPKALACLLRELMKDKQRLDGAVKYIGNIDLYVKPIKGMLISEPMICVGENLRECLDKINTALDAAMSPDRGTGKSI
jgi:hypothetical protein